MSIISHGGKDYDVPAYSVQDDSSATSLDSSKVPTGGTVQAVYGDPDTHMIKGTDYVTAGQKSGTTLGNKSTVEGYNNTAIAENSHAEGNETVVGKNGSCGHAEGYGSRANGHTAHAEGAMAWSTGTATHAEGCQTTASGDYSHAEGIYSEAKAAQAHAEGKGTLASSESQHVQGKYNIEDANGIYAHIVGNGTNSSNRSNIHTIDWSGNAWFAGDVTDGSGNVLSDKADTADLKPATIITTSNPIVITDSANAYANEVIANIEPIQDLHGYDHPWVGGAGKNILPMTVESIKAANTRGTWSENVYTLNNGTFEILTDNADNVTGIKVNGAFSGETMFIVGNCVGITDGTYKLNGCPAGGSTATYRLVANGSHWDTGEGADISVPSSWNKYVSIYVYTSVSNLIFKPMVRLATENDASFVPYTNICPISGLDSVEVKRIGKNLFNEIGKTENYFLNSNGVATANPNWNYTDYIPITGDNITMSYNSDDLGYAPSICFYDKYKNFISGSQYYNSKNKTFNVPINAKYFRASYFISWVSTFQIELGSTATDYEPYQLETHTTSLPQTTYGGTLNVQTGELVVDRIYKTFNGGETWYTDSRWPLSYYTAWTNDSKYTPSTIGFGNYIQCNKYNGVAKQVDNIQHGEILFNVGNISVASASIIIKDENYASVADLTTSLLSNPLQIVYELATPQTYHLTPEQVKLLKGYNYISTNADTLDLTYQVNNVLGEILSESEEYTDRVFDDLGTASKKDIETTLTNDENLPTGSAVISHLNSTYTPLNKAIVATKGSSKSTADGGNWTAMCISTQTGNPVLPTAAKWWNVISLDNWISAPNNWVSQLALPTQDSEHVYYRKNKATGTNIDSSPWTALLDANNSSLRAQHYGSIISSNNTSINFHCYRFYNGVKMISFTSDNFQTAKYVTEDGLIPDALRPTEQNVYGVGLNSQYDSTSSTSKSRAFLITTTGRIFIYASSAVGFNATLVYI